MPKLTSHQAQKMVEARERKKWEKGKPVNIQLKIEGLESINFTVRIPWTPTISESELIRKAKIMFRTAVKEAVFYPL